MTMAYRGRHRPDTTADSAPPIPDPGSPMPEPEPGSPEPTPDHRSQTAQRTVPEMQRAG
jgi:hypothetical protein